MLFGRLNRLKEIYFAEPYITFNFVFQIKWGPDMPDGEINFFSLAGDGRVLNWVLMQSKLSITPIITLYIGKRQAGSPDGIDIRLKSLYIYYIGDFLYLMNFLQ